VKEGEGSLQVAVRWKREVFQGRKDVVESEVEDGGEGLAEGDKGAIRAYDAACEDVVPVVD
jgi:hypothetical protein